MHLPEMMLFESKQNSTESSYLFKLSKLIGNKPDRKQDDHSLKKIREGDFSEIHFQKLFGEVHLKKIDEQMEHSGIDKNNVGGWLFIQPILKSIEALNEEQQQYIDFLLNLCEIDKSYIGFVSEKHADNNNDIEEINKSIRNWLLLPNFDVNKVNEKMGAELIVALLLQWSALYEYFLLIEYAQIEDMPSFLNYLPQINEKGKIECSNEVFLKRVKNKWASKNYSRDTIPWVTLFKDIERAKNKERPDFETFRVNPNIDKIKKTLTRWRNGKEGFLSIEAIKKELLVLYQDYDSEDFDFTLFIIVFIQLYDNIQRQIINEELSKEFVVEQFSRYPEYLKLVESRFKGYQETGFVKP